MTVTNNNQTNQGLVILLCVCLSVHSSVSLIVWTLYLKQLHIKIHKHVSSYPYCPLPQTSLSASVPLFFFLLLLFAALTSPHLNLIEFVCAANGSPNDTLIPPVKGDECLHGLAARSMLVIIFLIWWIPTSPHTPW